MEAHHSKLKGESEMRIELNREPRKMEIREVLTVASGEPFMVEHVFEPENGHC